jgi:hypothetical protein
MTWIVYDGMTGCPLADVHVGVEKIVVGMSK